MGPSLLGEYEVEDNMDIYAGHHNIIKILYITLTHSQTMTPIDAPGKQAFWEYWG